MSLITHRDMIDTARLSPGARRVLEDADSRSKGKPITVEHLVHAVLGANHDVGRALVALGVTPQALGEALDKIRKK